VDEEYFRATVAGALAQLRGVCAVALTGSRASRSARPASDWDLALYYDARFDPADVAALGWDGTVTALGQWGPGIGDGGAFLRVQGVRVDVHFRNMVAVRAEIRETQDGRFRIEANPVLLAGMPSYLLVAELATQQVLAGEAPEAVEYPPALRANAARVWWEQAQYAFGYARAAHAEHDRTLLAGGLVARAVAQTAHAVLAARGQWAPANEKTLLDRAGLGDLQRARAGRHDEVDRILARCADGVAGAEREGDR
jgi:hypothetical protein